MNIGLVITQLKSAAPLFAGNVAGAAEYENSVAEQVWLPPPAAYVIPLDTDAGENESMNGLYQICTERVGIIVALDNSADRRGQTAIATIDQVQAALFAAILNWRPNSSVDNPDQPAGNPQLDQEVRGFRLDHANLVGWDRARLFYQWDFALEVTISDADGWQPTSIPLTEIQMTFTSLNPIEVSGDVLMGSRLVSNVSNASNLADGMSIAGAGIAASTNIAGISANGTQITLSQAATATGTAVALSCVGTGASAPAQPTADIQLPQ